MVRLQSFKTVYDCAFQYLLQILVDIPNDVGDSHVHPLLITAVEKGAPLIFAKINAPVNFAIHQLKGLEANSGWQFVTVHLYDLEGSHRVHRFREHTCGIAVPDRLLAKVRNYVFYSQKTLQCNMPF